MGKCVTAEDRVARFKRHPLPSIRNEVPPAKLADALLVERYIDALGRIPREAYLKNTLTVWRLIEGRARFEHTDRGYSSIFQLAQGLYGAKEIPDQEAARRKRTSIRRWIELNVQAGVLEVEPVTDSRGAWRGLRWRIPSAESVRRSSSVARASLL